MYFIREVNTPFPTHLTPLSCERENLLPLGLTVEPRAESMRSHVPGSLGGWVNRHNKAVYTSCDWHIMFPKDPNAR